MPPPAWVAIAVEDLANVAQIHCVATLPIRASQPSSAAMDRPRAIQWPAGEAPNIAESADPWRTLPLADLDVVFSLGTRPTGNLPDTAPAWGIWGVSIDQDPHLARAATVAGDETATLWVDRIDDATGLDAPLEADPTARRLRESAIRVHRLSPTTTRNRLLAKAARLPARALGDLARGDRQSASGRPETRDTSTRDSSSDRDGTSTLAHAPSSTPRWTWLTLAARGVRTGVRRALHTNGWYLGFQIGPSMDADLQPESFQPILPPKDRFWADPFPVVLSPERALIYVEEWPDRLGRGRLAALEMHRNGSWQRLGTVMEEPIHLSHPYLFTWQGARYLIPETSARSTVELYRQQGDDPLDWKLQDVWMQDRRVVDVTVQMIGDRWWLLANIANEGISAHDELHAFHADTPLGPWTEHAANPIVSDPRCARPAGQLYYHDQRLIRPGQDCGQRYGRAITLCEVLELTPTRYVERIIRRIGPAPFGANRLHTLNTDDWLRVIDLHRDRRRFL
jgi:hypothetical protein